MVSNPETRRRPLNRPRQTEHDPFLTFIVSSAHRLLVLVRTRCDEALKALETQDYFVAIGALSGLDEQIINVRLRLLILIEFKIQQDHQ